MEFAHSSQICRCSNTNFSLTTLRTSHPYWFIATAVKRKKSISPQGPFSSCCEAFNHMTWWTASDVFGKRSKTTYVYPQSPVNEGYMQNVWCIVMCMVWITAAACYGGLAHSSWLQIKAVQRWRRSFANKSNSRARMSHCRCCKEQTL